MKKTKQKERVKENNATALRLNKIDEIDDRNSKISCPWPFE